MICIWRIDSYPIWISLASRSDWIRHRFWYRLRGNCHFHSSVNCSTFSTSGTGRISCGCPMGWVLRRTDGSMDTRIWYCNWGKLSFYTTRNSIQWPRICSIGDWWCLRWILRGSSRWTRSNCRRYYSVSLLRCWTRNCRTNRNKHAMPIWSRNMTVVKFASGISELCHTAATDRFFTIYNVF